MKKDGEKQTNTKISAEWYAIRVYSPHYALRSFENWNTGQFME
jgi:hypothetical protein